MSLDRIGDYTARWMTVSSQEEQNPAYRVAQHSKSCKESIFAIVM